MRARDFITEAVFDITTDTEWIYNKYFKDYAESIVNGTWNLARPNPVTFFSAELKSADAKKANKINPVKIIIHDASGGNGYYPAAKYIALNINSAATAVVAEYNGIEGAIAQVSKIQGKQLRTEFTPARIKGSINHELSHWIDDSLHNLHIRTMLDRANKTGDNSVVLQGNPAVALTKYEINAQIHSIIELKKANSDMWDLFSFEDMVDLNASLKAISLQLQTIGHYKKWKHVILHRMARENLLGKEMTKNY